MSFGFDKYSRRSSEGPTKRSSEPEPADSLRDRFNAIGGWLPPLTLALYMPKRRTKFDYSNFDYDTLFELGQEVFYNGYSLLFDSCLLFGNESYPSAYGLAVLSLEEFGKFSACDHIGFESELNDDGTNDYKRHHLGHLFSGKQFYNHSWKQQWGSLHKPDRDDFADIERLVSDGTLDQRKQESFYVDLEQGVVGTPTRIGRNEARSMIEYAFASMKGIGDLPFFPLGEDSTPETKEIAATYSRDIQEFIDTTAGENQHQCGTEQDGAGQQATSVESK